MYTAFLAGTVVTVIAGAALVARRFRYFHSRKFVECETYLDLFVDSDSPRPFKFAVPRPLFVDEDDLALTIGFK